MFRVNMETQCGVEVARVVKDCDLVAGQVKPAVDGAQLTHGRVGRLAAVTSYLAQVRHEFVLGDQDLVVPGWTFSDKRHRPEMALGRHSVDHLPGIVCLRVQRGQGFDLVVHPIEHEDAEYTQAQQQHRDREETDQQLDVDGGFDPGHPVDQRSQEVRERAEVGLLGYRSSVECGCGLHGASSPSCGEKRVRLWWAC